jgi:hypothetical protein
MKNVPEEYLGRMASVYGDECKARLLELAELATPEADIDELADQAIQQIFGSRSSGNAVSVGTLRFNSK